MNLVETGIYKERWTMDVPSLYDAITVSGTEREIKITAQAHCYSLKDKFLTMN